MTREQIEADIRSLSEAKAYPDELRQAQLRAIDRLRADLARLDGPAEGFVRVRLAVGRINGSDGSCFVAAEERTYDKVIRGEDGDPIAIVVADLPLPRAVEVEGTVET